MQSIRYTPWWAKAIGGLALFAVGLGALGLLYIIFGKMPAASKASLYLETAKAIFQLIGVLLLGTLVAAIVKYFENSRKADKALHDFRVDFLNRLRSLDESVKKSRHALRSSGLTNQFGPQNPVITEVQVKEYDLQLASLQEAEIGIDRLIQDIADFRNVFSGNVMLENKLRNMQLFLKALVEEYESSRPKFPQVLSGNLPRLSGFTGIPADTEYNAWLSGYAAAVSIVRQDLLPLEKAIKS